MSRANRKATTKPAVAPAYIDPASLPAEYSLRISGSCMAPAMPDGALAHIVREPTKTGDLVIVWFRPGVLPDGTEQAQIKRLAMAPPHYVTFPWRDHPKSELHACMFLEMDNPPKRFAVRCSDVLAIHKCLGVFNGKGRKVTAKEQAAVRLLEGV